MLLFKDGRDWSLNSARTLVHREAQTTITLHARIRSLVADENSGRSTFLVGGDDERTIVSLKLIANDPAPAACWCNEPFVLVSIVDGQRNHDQQDLDLLTNVFALTPAEARLALALVDGLSLQSYSDRTGVRITTVRWHLRNALAKTGCASQRDFVRLIISSTEA